MFQLQPQPQLLVSVRHITEARAALAGGANLIDIKEPAAGPLGMAARPTIAHILHDTDSRLPVTAALGELHEPAPHSPLPESLRYLKIGLADAPTDWRARLRQRAEAIGHHRFIAVAYADDRRAGAPPVADVLEWAITHRVAGLLLDTAVKDGRSLLDCCPAHALRRWTATARQHRLLIALAGSLSQDMLPKVLALEPDVIAVRSAACAARKRTGAVTVEAVRRLKQAIEAHSARIRPMTRAG